MKLDELELDLCYYRCGDLICDNEACTIYNAIIRCISKDDNMPAEKVYQEYLKALVGEDDIDYKGVIEALIAFLIKPNLEESYGFKNLVSIDKYPNE